MTEPVTFWSAARDVVAECHAVLKPGGMAVWVTKDFVRAKKRVCFSADWVRLCESCGFTLVKWVRASVVSETVHGDLFLGETVKRTERKSFFRRLAEKKGSPRIDHEDVLFFVKEGGAGVVDCVLSSPPYADGGQGGGGDRLGFKNAHGISEYGSLRDGYGTAPGQLGALPAGSVDVVIGSPPFSDSQQVDDREKPSSAMSSTWRKRQGTITDGTTDGNLGNLKPGTIDAVVSSPPYAEIAPGAGGLNTKLPKHPGHQHGRSAESPSQNADKRYGETDGQLSRLPCGEKMRPGELEDARCERRPCAEGTSRATKRARSTIRPGASRRGASRCPNRCTS